MIFDRKCPKCSSEMERGFLRDRVRGRFSRPVEWIAGLPEISWNSSVKTKDKIRCRVEAFRCKNCGYLEQYASKPLPKAGLFDI